MTKKWLDLFLVQSSIPLSQGWLDLRSVKSPADRRTKAARRNASAISSAVISSLANGAASERPSELRHRQKQQCRRRKRMALSARDSDSDAGSMDAEARRGRGESRKRCGERSRQLSLAAFRSPRKCDFALYPVS